MVRTRSPDLGDRNHRMGYSYEETPLSSADYHNGRDGMVKGAAEIPDAGHHCRGKSRATETFRIGAHGVFA